jgi:hypothetical protein
MILGPTARNPQDGSSLLFVERALSHSSPELLEHILGNVGGGLLGTFECLIEVD